jgi:hypothetical protein
VHSAILFGLLLQPPAGIPPEWELRPKIEKIAPEVARLAPLLNQLQPDKWVAAGAPEAYHRQWKDCVDSIPQIEALTARWAAKPLQLSLAAETLVRLETYLQHAASLSQAVRRYQNPAMAEILEGEVLAAGASRDWIRQYVLDLSRQREGELEVAQSEADRCRIQLAKPPGRK